jgi:hypothetical protein
MNAFLLFLVLVNPQTDYSLSPDSKFKIDVRSVEESDQRVRYITSLTSIHDQKRTELCDCVRRDLSAPIFYWSEGGDYLIFEACSDSFRSNTIQMIDPHTLDVKLKVTGVLAPDPDHQGYFDSKHDMLIYYNTEKPSANIPDLYSLDCRNNIKTKLKSFDARFEMEFPSAVMDPSRRTISLKFNDHNGVAQHAAISY